MPDLRFAMPFTTKPKHFKEVTAMQGAVILASQLIQQQASRFIEDDKINTAEMRRVIYEIKRQLLSNDLP